MRALTLKAHWASLVASGEKTVENRSWRTLHRGPLAIHRGGKDGAIVAVVNVLEVVPYTDEALWRVSDDTLDLLCDQEKLGYVCGPYCWVLGNVRRLKRPIPCKGALGLWTVPDSIVRQLERRGIHAMA